RNGAAGRGVSPTRVPISPGGAAMRFAPIVVWALAVPMRGQDIRVDRVFGAVNVRQDQLLSPGDRIVTGRGRADVLIDPAVYVRVESASEIAVERRDDGKHRLRIARGTVLYDVTGPNAAAVEAAVPQVGVWPTIPGVFKIEVNRRDESAITA